MVYVEELIQEYIKRLDGITVEEWETLKIVFDNKVKLNKDLERISVSKAAQIMHLDPHFIRLCLQDGTFSFGVAKKNPGIRSGVITYHPSYSMNMWANESINCRLKYTKKLQKY